MTYEEALATIASDRAAREEIKKGKERERVAEWNKSNPGKAQERSRKWYRNNREKLYRNNIRRKYGIDVNTYNRLVELQGAKCAVCGGSTTNHTTHKRFHIDHCHNTGLVRGLLCHRCNTMLGHSKDDPTLLRKAAEYLERATVVGAEIFNEHTDEEADGSPH